MERYDPFEKLSDLYDSIVEWQDDPLIKPENQNKYFFSDGKTYYEELCKILKLLSVFKNGFDQIYNNLDELEQQIIDNGVTKEDLNEAINNLHAVITSEIAVVESSLSSDITNVETSVSQLASRVTASEGNISSLQTLTSSHTTDIASLQSATDSLNTRMGTAETNISALQTLTSTHSSDIQTINTAISSIQQSLATKISDAPMDGKTYGRKNGAWQEVTGGGGGGGTSDYDDLDNKPQINGNILTGNKTANQLGLADVTSLGLYVSKAEAPGYADILTQTSASAIYQTIVAMSSYLLKNDAPGYADILTKTDASSLYQTITAMSNYLLKTDAPGYADILTQASASAIYQTIANMSNYLLKSDAPGYGDILTETEAAALYQTIAGMSNYMPIDRKASASQLGGIKVGNGLNIDNDGVLSNSSNVVYGAWQTVNITGSTSTATTPVYSNVNIQVKYDTDKKNLLFNGSFTARGSGATVETIITTDLVIPNNTGQEISIKNVVIRDNFKARLFIDSDGVVKFGVYGTTNNSDYGILPIPINIDNFV